METCGFYMTDLAIMPMLLLLLLVCIVCYSSVFEPIQCAYERVSTLLLGLRPLLYWKVKVGPGLLICIAWWNCARENHTHTNALVFTRNLMVLQRFNRLLVNLAIKQARERERKRRKLKFKFVSLATYVCCTSTGFEGHLKKVKAVFCC